MENQQNQQQIQLKITDDVAKGVYSNLMEIKHNKEEFCLDFMNVFPPIGAVTARVIVSPGHLKRMIKALQRTVKKYEEDFGSISEAEEPKKTGIGFHAN